MKVQVVLSVLPETLLMLIAAPVVAEMENPLSVPVTALLNSTTSLSAAVFSTVRVKTVGRAFTELVTALPVMAAKGAPSAVVTVVPE
ncbi:hypothetical protein AGMMS49991_05300 [Spirochaetia bacterium]|nr:hypothetical protein AGMMS49991_05300 [Spirochaetia bacterium]